MTDRGFNIFGIFVNWYGVIIAFGMMLAVFLAIKTMKKNGFKVDNVIDIALICIPCAILGARTYYVIFDDKIFTFWQFFEIWNGGLAIFGGIIGGLIGVCIYCRIKKLDTWSACDALAPCLVLGQVIGRWGNFTNQEAYGSLITDPAFQMFPFAVNISSEHFTEAASAAVVNAYGAGVDSAWFMATFFYESFWNLLLFGFLLFLFFKVGIRGLTTCAYFALYGIARFVIEGFRLDSLYWGPFRVSQALSLLLVIAFVACTIYIILKHKKQKKLQANINPSPPEEEPKQKVVPLEVDYSAEVKK